MIPFFPSKNKEKKERLSPFLFQDYLQMESIQATVSALLYSAAT